MTDQTPKIMTYVSPTDYLNDLYQFQKTQNSGFSFESWSVELGYRSRSFMKMLCSGKRRITVDFVDNFSAKMLFKPIEKEYFETLVSYGDAHSARDKTIYLDKMFEIRGRAKQLACIEDDSFVLDPQLPALQTLLTFKDVLKTSSNLSKLMNISISDMETLLGKLADLDLIRFDDSTQSWQVLKTSFKVPTKLGSAALASFHTYSALESIRAQLLPVESRKFRSILIPLNSNSYKEFCSELESIIARFLAKYDSDQLEDAMIYKVNLNAYPITKAQVRTLKTENRIGLVLK